MASETILRPSAPLPKSATFVRACIALAAAKGDPLLAKKMAAASAAYRTTPNVGECIEALDFAAYASLEQIMAAKTGVAAGTPNDSTWATSLVYANFGAEQFAALLRAGTIIGRLPLRQVPLNLSYPKQTGGATVGWVGPGKPAVLSTLAFATNTLGVAKAAGILVVTNALLQFGRPDCETLMANELQRAMTQFLDTQFIDPSVTALATVSPGSITHGATAIQSTGPSATQLAADLESLIGTLADQNETDSLYLVMSRRMAVSLAAKRDTAGGLAFPNVNINGGEIFGVPVVTSNAVPTSVSAGSIIVAVNGSGIDYGEVPGLIGLSVSDKASVQMDTAPSNDSSVPTATTTVSLWQVDSTGLLLTAYANWKRVRDTAVAYLDNVHTS